MSDFLSTSELEFGKLKQNLKTFLQQQPQFQDYDFEGSNLAAIIDLLTYNTYMNAFYLNQVGTESFLDTAKLFESVASHAKELNYVPRSRSSSSAQVNMSVSGNANEGSISLDKFTEFTAAVGANNLIFSTNEEVVVVNDGTGTFVANNVTLHEGEIVTEYFTESGENNRFALSSENVDISSLDVTVQLSNTDFSNTAYTRAENLFELTPTSRVFFVQAAGDRKYEIEFGNDITGRKLKNQNVVRARYRVSSGLAGDKALTFTSANSSITATTINTSTGGSEREDIDSIRFNAPRVFATQDRAVTTEDYKALITTEFPFIETMNVIGGERLDPPRFGKVQIVAKPFGANLMTDAQKDAVVDYLRGKTSQTTEVLMGDAEFINLIIDSTVTYNSTQTSLTSNQIKDLAITAINAYGTNSLTKFNNDFRHSKLTTLIDGIDSSVISNNTKVSVAKRISPQTLTSNTMVLNFNQRIKNETDFNVPSISSSRFYRTINGVRYIAFLEDKVSEEATQGIIQMKAEVDNSSIVIISNAGTIDYTTGVITLNDFLVSGYFNRGRTAFGDHINVIARAYDQDVLADDANILLIESEDVNVSVVGQLTND